MEIGRYKTRNDGLAKQRKNAFLKYALRHRERFLVSIGVIRAVNNKLIIALFLLSTNKARVSF